MVVGFLIRNRKYTEMVMIRVPRYRIEAQCGIVCFSSSVNSRSRYLVFDGVRLRISDLLIMPFSLIRSMFRVQTT